VDQYIASERKPLFTQNQIMCWVSFATPARTWFNQKFIQH